MPNAGHFKKPIGHRRRPIWEQSEGDDIFATDEAPYEIDEFQYKPMKKDLIFKPHNYLIPRAAKRKKSSSISCDSVSRSKSPVEVKERKDPDEQFEDLLKKINFSKADFDPPPQIIQPNLINPPYVTGDVFKYYRQRASTTYDLAFKPPPHDCEKTASFKPYFLTRDSKDDVPYDFANFRRTPFSHIRFTNKRGIFPFLHGPPMPDVRVIQSEYNLRFKNHFPVKTPATKVIPENTPKFLQYLT